MKKIQVKVCVCTACVMNGSVEIMESVESLSDLPHQEDAPVIAVDDKVFRKADAESVMAYIVERVQNGEQ